MIQLFKSDKKDKIYMAVFENGSVVHFSDDRYQNYTKMKAEKGSTLFDTRKTKIGRKVAFKQQASGQNISFGLCRVCRQKFEIQSDNSE